MRNVFNVIRFAVLSLAGLLLTVRVGAQYMPMVYDKTFGTGGEFTLLNADFGNGDVVLAGNDGGKASFTWLDRNGDVRVFQRFDVEAFEEILSVTPIGEDMVLLTGYRHSDESDRRLSSTGHAMVLTADGSIVRDFYIGDAGTQVQKGHVFDDGTIILSGKTRRAGQDFGFVAKVSNRDQLLYFYTAPTGSECVAFDASGVLSNLYAAFSSDGEGSCVVRLDENGKPYYITTIEDMSYVIEGMVPMQDGHLYVIGQGQAGGTVLKIRPEGDIVFNKTIVPAGSDDVRMSQIALLSTGEIFAGGNGGGNTYYCILRSDGTMLTTSTDRGEILAVANNLYGNQYVMSLFDETSGRGKVIMLSKSGRKLYEKVTAAPYSTLKIDGNDDLLMAAPSTGRLSMLSSKGDLLFDRYVQENMPMVYDQAYLSYTGEVYFVGAGANLTKLAHGVYVSDVSITKPIEGTTVATFNVNLTGYSFNSDGTPRPVTVYYRTAPRSAREGVNFTPVSGVLSFVPSPDPTDNYLARTTVEVPVLANNYLEGDRVFDLVLTDVTNSYVIKERSQATIVDLPAVVRMIGSTPGTEGKSNVKFELGLYKTNGVKLTNSTGADIVIDGSYGNGTADNQDFDWTRLPRLFINPGSHSGTFEVVTVEDTRYENVKTVVVDFNSISAMSDTEISFGGSMLSCEGLIYDQPAMVGIEALGDFNKQNNVVSSLFKVTLLRVRDGAVQTNCSGGDIVVSTEVDGSSTATRGTDFVLTNDHDIRIWGDDRSSATNLSGIVLFTPDSENKTVTVNINGVTAVEGAGPIGINGDQKSASFTIIGK